MTHQGYTHQYSQWRTIVPFVVILALYFLLRQQLGITEFIPGNTPGQILVGFLTFLRAVGTYARLFLFPVGLYFDRSQRVWAGLEPELILTVLVFWAAVVGLWRLRRHISKLEFFCMIWFALELAPVAQIVTSIGVGAGYISTAEHFLYLPSIPALTLIVLGAQRIFLWNTKTNYVRPLIVKAAAVGFIIFFLLTTVQQNFYAANELALLKESINHQPHNSRVLFSIGMIYADRQLFAEAEQYFRRALAVDSAHVRAQIALGKSLCDQGRYEEGLAQYKKIKNPGSLKNLLENNIRLTDGILRK